MKTLYRSLSIKSFTIVMAALTISCSSRLSYQEAMNRNARKIDNPENLNDARFLVDATSFNLAEMKLAEAAITNGYASTIVDLSRKHLDELKQMDEDLSKLARKEKVALPAAMSSEHESYVNGVSSIAKEDFDRAYIETVSRINKQNTEKYMTMATDGKDADIRAFSARKLDMLRSHAKALDDAEKKLMNTY
jgi:putative membrane protein